MADPKPNSKKSPPKKKARDEFDGDDIFQAPMITREPSSRQAKLGSRVVLRVQASGKPLPSFQWFQNGKKISGANTDRLTLTKVRRQAIGAYHCEAKNFVGKAVSREAMLSFFTSKVPKLVIGPELSKLSEGKPFTLSVTSPSSEELKDFKIYWMFNGMRIKGANGATLNISGVKKKYEGEYKAMVSTGSGLETSNVAKLIVKPPKAAKAAPETAPETAPERAPEEALVAEAPQSLDDILSEKPTISLSAPETAPAPSWDEFNFNPEDEGATEDHDLVAPLENSELFGNTSPGTSGAPRSPISQLATQDLILELNAQGVLNDPSTLISAAEGSFTLSGLLDMPTQEDPSRLIEMLTDRAPEPEPEAEPEAELEYAAAPEPDSIPDDEESDDDLIADWGIAPAVKKTETGLQSMAAALARTQLTPNVHAPVPAPLPKRSSLTLARKKAFLEEMMKKFQARGKLAA